VVNVVRIRRGEMGAYWWPLTEMRMLRMAYKTAEKKAGATTVKKHCTTK
jgi:hypothetical protein